VIFLLNVGQYSVLVFIRAMLEKEPVGMQIPAMEMITVIQLDNVFMTAIIRAYPIMNFVHRHVSQILMAHHTIISVQDPKALLAMIILLALLVMCVMGAAFVLETIHPVM
jgi:hypothetical protein